MKKLPPWLLNTACILAPILSGLSLYQTVRLFLPLPAAFVLYGIAFVCLIIFCIRMPKWLVGIIVALTVGLVIFGSAFMEWSCFLPTEYSEKL